MSRTLNGPGSQNWWQLTRNSPSRHVQSGGLYDQMRDITGNMLQAASMHEKAACLRPSEPTLVILSHSSKPVGQLSGAQFCQEPSPLLLPLPLGTVGPHCSLPLKQTQWQRQPKKHTHRACSGASRHKEHGMLGCSFLANNNRAHNHWGAIWSQTLCSIREMNYPI